MRRPAVPVLVACLLVVLASVAWVTRCSFVACFAASPPPPTGSAGSPGTPPAELGLMQVAPGNEGSSDPTYYSNSHRLAQTAGGRLLTVFGSHASGLQLAWRDAGSATWSRGTTGDVRYGQLLWGMDTGDWPASIAVVPGYQGAPEVAVVVWSGQNHGSAQPVMIRVLTDLDSSDGPRVGAPVTVAAPALGAARPDVGVEIGADGRPRVLLTWSERAAPDSYTIVAAWLDDHGAPAPALTSSVLLYEGPSTDQTATVAETPQGVRVAATTLDGRLRVFGHDLGADLGEWWASGAGDEGPSQAFPSAAGLPTGEVLVASSRDPTGATIAVQRFSGPTRAPSTELELHGYTHPSLAADAGHALLVAIRVSDGAVVSRAAPPDRSWSDADRVEIEAARGEGLAWPSAFADMGRRHLVVRGPSNLPHRSSVLAVDRAA